MKYIFSVIGDGGLPRGDPKLALAEDIGRVLVDCGGRVMTGGTGAVMEAAHRGARSSSSYAPGDCVGILPSDDVRYANEFVDVAIPTGLGHGRNRIVARGDAVIAIGGGAGTLSEICFAWMHQRLVIAMRVEGWSGKVADAPLDPRPRFGGGVVDDDRIFGADTADDVRAILDDKLALYRDARL